jgi:hypothetical protein
MAFATAFHKAVYKKEIGEGGKVIIKGIRGNVFPSYVKSDDHSKLLNYGDEGGELVYGDQEWDFSEYHDYNENQKKRFHTEPVNLGAI